MRVRARARVCGWVGARETLWLRVFVTVYLPVRACACVRCACVRVYVCALYVCVSVHACGAVGYGTIIMMRGGGVGWGYVRARVRGCVRLDTCVCASK